MNLNISSQSQSLSRPPKRWAVRTSSSRSRLKKHTQPLNDLGFIVQPISLLETKTRGGPPQYRIKDGNGTTIPYGNEILPNGRIFRIFIHFPFLKKEYSIRISAVCLHCQLFIYLFSCLFTFSAVCLLFQLFIYIVSCYVHVQLFVRYCPERVRQLLSSPFPAPPSPQLLAAKKFQEISWKQLGWNFLAATLLKVRKGRGRSWLTLPRQYLVQRISTLVSWSFRKSGISKKSNLMFLFSLSSKNSHQEDFNMIRNEPLFTGTPAARKNSGHRTVIRVDSQGKKSKEETR